MDTLNQGLVYSDDNCIGCQHCIAVCPVIGANVFSSEPGRKRVDVDGSKCLHCGNCIGACTHGARHFRDDTDAFLDALKSGEPLSVIVSASFFVNYGDKAKAMLGYLRSLGVEKMYEASIGSDICNWVYSDYLTTHGDKTMISPLCPVMVNYFSKFSPILYESLVPIHSPMICTAIYARKYKGDRRRIAFIGSCIAKKDEMSEPDVRGLVDFNVTMNHLSERVKGVDFSGFEEPDIESRPGLGFAYAIFGGQKENIEMFIGDKRAVMTAPNAGLIKWEHESMERIYAENSGTVDTPFIIEFTKCSYGCAEGSARGSSEYNALKIFSNYLRRKDLATEPGKNNPYSRELSCGERLRLLRDRYSDFSADDFLRRFPDRYVQPFDVPDSVISEVFSAMHKDTAAKQHIDCGSCGYVTCREMARAIAYGYNQPENCVHFSKDEIQYISQTDTRSLVSSSNAFNSRVQQLIDRRSVADYAVIVLKAADWDLVCERYGYDTGSEIFFKYARQIRDMLLSDELIARRSETTYMVLLRKSRLDSFIPLIRTCDIYVDTLAAAQPVTVSMRIGIYEMTGEELHVGDVFNRIHILVNNFLESGESIIHYDDRVRSDILFSMTIAKNVPNGLSKHEFVAYFQPKVSVSSHVLEGAEALVRWTHDGGGLITPASFIPVCEKTGLVGDIDFYMLDSVCAAIREWIDNGLEPVKVSTNFSKINFRSSEIADRIINTVDKWDIPHELIEIEFTETAYIEGAETLRHALRKLRDSGFSIAMDDFGTGYTSLSLLQTLPCDVLKLDHSIVSESVSGDKSKKVLRSIIAMAKDLDIKTVAEGVESSDEYNLLRSLGCDLIQGFYFDKPLCRDDFEQRLRCPTYIAV